MITTDFHMHSSISADSDAPMNSMIESAIDKKIKHICFTEHLDLDFPECYGMDFTFDIEQYFKTVKRMKEFYKNDIEIFYGIELGVMPHLADRYNTIISQHDFDFVIASSHLVDYKDPYYPDFWNNITYKQGYRMYFQTILDNIDAFDNFDAYGHLDYIIRYGDKSNRYIDYDEFSELLDAILKKLIARNKALEVNTAGYKYGLSEPNPNRHIIEKYLEFGGRLITIGADAHAPEHVGYDFQKAELLLKNLGVREYAYFKKRKPVYVQL